MTTFLRRRRLVVPGASHLTVTHDARPGRILRAAPQVMSRPHVHYSNSDAFVSHPNDTVQQQGGLEAFGYPISEELPKISSADGKVYTVQYFERARFEWHPTEAGTDSQVQLGLIGKQARDMK